MVMGFNHSGVVVKDIDKIVAFYRDVLGLEVEREVDSKAPPTGDHTGIPGVHRKLVFMGFPNGEHSLELVYYHTPEPKDGHLHHTQLGGSHICFNVANLAELHAKLSEQGVRFITEPKFRMVANGFRVGICYALDPEGNYLELMERTKVEG